jgi:hypothetical protein
MIVKRLMAVTVTALIGGGAYFVASQTPPAATPMAVPAANGHGLIVPTVAAKAHYPELVIFNPTQVLLGEEKVPEHLLVAPAPPAVGLVVPTLPGK